MWLKLLGFAALHDEHIGRLAETAGLLALDVTPRGLQVLTTTTGLGLTFTTTVGVVDGVHTHTAHGRTDTHPTGATGLTGGLVHVLGVAHLTDGAVALHTELADFAGRHLNQGVLTITVGEHSLLTGGASNLTTGTGTNLDVVNSSTQGYILEGHSVAHLGSHVLTALHRHADGQAHRSQDVALGAISVLDEGDAAGAVRVILNTDHGSSFRAGAAEVHQAVVVLVATADVAGGDAAVVVAATALADGLQEALFRLGLGDLVECGQNLVTVGRSGRLK